MAKKKDEEGNNTALAVVEPANYPVLNADSDLAEAMRANLQSPINEADLVRVPTPAGGGTQWVVPTVSGEERTKALTGIIVYYGPRGVLWPSEDVGSSPPLLVTNNLITAQRVGDDYGDIDPEELEKYADGNGGYDWVRLPWNQWGTGKKGIGKRCKESRLLFLLREGEPFPILVRAQPGSLKTVRPFVEMRLPVPYWRAVVELTLEKRTSKAGPEYSQIVPRLVGTLTREQGELVKVRYTDEIARMIRGAMLEDRED